MPGLVAAPPPPPPAPIIIPPAPTTTTAPVPSAAAAAVPASSASAGLSLKKIEQLIEFEDKRFIEINNYIKYRRISIEDGDNKYIKALNRIKLRIANLRGFEVYFKSIGNNEGDTIKAYGWGEHCYQMSPNDSGRPSGQPEKTGISSVDTIDIIKNDGTRYRFKLNSSFQVQKGLSEEEDFFPNGFNSSEDKYYVKDSKLKHENHYDIATTLTDSLLYKDHFDKKIMVNGSEKQLVERISPPTATAALAPTTTAEQPVPPPPPRRPAPPLTPKAAAKKATLAARKARKATLAAKAAIEATRSAAADEEAARAAIAENEARAAMKVANEARVAAAKAIEIAVAPETIEIATASRATAEQEREQERERLEALAEARQVAEFAEGALARGQSILRQALRRLSSPARPQPECSLLDDESGSGDEFSAQQQTPAVDEPPAPALSEYLSSDDEGDFESSGAPVLDEPPAAVVEATATLDEAAARAAKALAAVDEPPAPPPSATLAAAEAIPPRRLAPPLSECSSSDDEGDFESSGAPVLDEPPAAAAAAPSPPVTRSLSRVLELEREDGDSGYESASALNEKVNGYFRSFFQFLFDVSSKEISRQRFGIWRKEAVARTELRNHVLDFIKGCFEDPTFDDVLRYVNSNLTELNLTDIQEKIEVIITSKYSIYLAADRKTKLVSRYSSSDDERDDGLGSGDGASTSDEEEALAAAALGLSRFVLDDRESPESTVPFTDKDTKVINDLMNHSDNYDDFLLIWNKLDDTRKIYIKKKIFNPAIADMYEIEKKTIQDIRTKIADFFPTLKPLQENLSSCNPDFIAPYNDGIAIDDWIDSSDFNDGTKYRNLMWLYQLYCVTQEFPDYFLIFCYQTLGIIPGLFSKITNKAEFFNKLKDYFSEYKIESQVERIDSEAIGIFSGKTPQEKMESAKDNAERIGTIINSYTDNSKNKFFIWKYFYDNFASMPFSEESSEHGSSILLDFNRFVDTFEIDDKCKNFLRQIVNDYEDIKTVELNW